MRLGRVAIALLLLTTACGDEPGGPATPTTALTLCPSPSWRAYRNDDGPWTRMVPEADGRVRIDATPRFAVAAMSSLDGPDAPQLTVTYLSAAQAQEYFGSWCRPEVPRPSGRISGTLLGIGDGSAWVHYGGLGAAGGVRSSLPTFELVPFEGENDLVATRFPPVVVPGHADRMIIRRAQRLAAGESVTLDFASAEAFPIATHTLSWNGPPADVRHEFGTAEGGGVQLQWTYAGSAGEADGPRSTTLHAVPAARLAAGDLHLLMLRGGGRQVHAFYHEPRDRTITWGAPVSRPTFSGTGTSPNVRVRADVVAQPEYDAVVSVSLFQDLPAGTTGLGSRVVLTATREHFGTTPPVWSLEVPDLSRVPGFQNVFGMRPGAFYWGITATSRPLGFTNRDGTDGTVHRSAEAGGEGMLP